MMEIRNRIGRRSGFTLIEVIAVLVIAAILAAVLITRGLSTADVNLQAEVDTLKSHLRYAQYLAMNDIPPNRWGIEVGDSAYELVKYEGGIKQVHILKLPNESSATHSFSPIMATAWTVLFDEWGSPTITGVLNIGGQSITITPNTGFIP